MLKVGTKVKVKVESKAKLGLEWDFETFERWSTVVRPNLLNAVVKNLGENVFETSLVAKTLESCI